MKRIVLIGGGGHALSVLDSLLCLQEYEVIGYTDNSGNAGDTLMGVPFLGQDEVLPRLYEEGIEHAAIAVGSVGSTVLREKLYLKAKSIGFALPAIVDPTAIIARACKIAEGVYIGKGAVVNSSSVIDRMAIINTRAIVEHQSRLGVFCHIAPGAILGGNTIIGDHTHVGIGSVIIQGIHVGHHVLIGAGSVVVRNISDLKKAYGNPCREAGSV
ncbi:acetyltransferase [Paenibacillus sp. NFR01]|uniref:acetyltransferase n=1 Tax=Paenibacillus sp. NFR01 TaxID=1566279 RepID=UPI000B86708B|nr:acetyltransferase [Paenibacillus sp. NFR01]